MLDESTPGIASRTFRHRLIFANYRIMIDQTQAT